MLPKQGARVHRTMDSSSGDDQNAAANASSTEPGENNTNNSSVSSNDDNPHLGVDRKNQRPPASSAANHNNGDTNSALPSALVRSKTDKGQKSNKAVEVVALLPGRGGGDDQNAAANASSTEPGENNTNNSSVSSNDDNPHLGVDRKNQRPPASSADNHNIGDTNSALPSALVRSKTDKGQKSDKAVEVVAPLPGRGGGVGAHDETVIARFRTQARLFVMPTFQPHTLFSSLIHTKYAIHLCKSRRSAHAISAPPPRR